MPEYLVGEGELAVEVGQRRRLGVGFQDHVVPLATVPDRVRQTALAPGVCFDRLRSRSSQLLGEAVDEGPDGILFQAGVEDDHDFIGPHKRLT